MVQYREANLRPLFKPCQLVPSVAGALLDPVHTRLNTVICSVGPCGYPKSVWGGVGFCSGECEAGWGNVDRWGGDLEYRLV